MFILTGITKGLCAILAIESLIAVESILRMEGFRITGLITGGTEPAVSG
jgi:hypothetical protein